MTTHLSEWLKKKTVIKPNADEDMETWITYTLLLEI